MFLKQLVPSQWESGVIGQLAASLLLNQQCSRSCYDRHISSCYFQACIKLLKQIATSLNFIAKFDKADRTTCRKITETRNTCYVSLSSRLQTHPSIGLSAAVDNQSHYHQQLWTAALPFFGSQNAPQCSYWWACTGEGALRNAVSRDSMRCKSIKWRE